MATTSANFVTDVPAANAPAAPAAGADVPSGGFDAILVLETLAATLTSLAGDAATATAANADANIDVPDIDVRSSDDDGGDSSDDLLEFLQQLVVTNGLMPTPASGGAAVTTTDADADGSADPGADVVGTDPGAHGAAKNALPLPAPPDLSNAITDKTQVSAGDALKAAATVGAAAALTPTSPAPLPAEPVKSDSQANSATRAVELMANVLKHNDPVPVERAPISTPVRDPRWANELGTRLSLMLKGAESSASLQLTPADLGPLDVSVTIRDSQATVHFGAAHAETRAILEASLPRLRELLAAQGFQLTDASVSSGFARRDRAPTPGVSQRVDGEVEAVAAASTTRVIHGTSLLDLYA